VPFIVLQSAVPPSQVKMFLLRSKARVFILISPLTRTVHFILWLACAEVLDLACLTLNNTHVKRSI